MKQFQARRFLLIIALLAVPSAQAADTALQYQQTPLILRTASV